MENDAAAKKTEERPHRSGPVLTMARSRRKEIIFVWAMLVLPIVHFCIFYVWLNFNSILMSFQEGYEMEWVDGFPFLTGNIRYGFQNFLSIFQDKDGILTKILPNTLKYFGVNLLLMLPLSLIVSYFLYKKVPGNVFFRYVFFLPVIVSGIIYVTSFTEIIGMYGPVYNIMESLGLKWKNWLIYEDTATPTILFYTVWTGLGTNMLLYQSAMSRIPDEVMQVAKLDGVSWGRELFQLVIPMIWPTLSMTILLAFTGIFTGGGIVLLFATQGGSSGGIETIYYWLFYKTDNEGASSLLGDAAAVGLFFTLLSFPIMYAVKWVLGKLDPQIEF